MVHNNHNFAFIEEQDGEKYFVVRKDSTPVFRASAASSGHMMDVSVIVRGLDTPAAKVSHYSPVHCAGRIISRTKAAEKFEGWGRKQFRLRRA